jgi:hypothetical protein
MDGTPALLVSSSTVHLFGISTNMIEGGEGGRDAFGYVQGESASAVEAMDSIIYYSGVQFVTYGSKPDFWVKPGHPCTIQKIEPEVPVITLGGSGQVGDYIEPALHGNSGSSFSLFYGLVSTALPLGNMLTHLHLDPVYFVYLSSGTIPQGQPSTVLINIPSQATAWQGVPIHFQAYVIVGPGQHYLSTSAAFVVR